jgi:hypothetical protein
MAHSLRLDAAELSVLSSLLGMGVSPLSGPHMTRAEAIDSLLRRRIIDQGARRVNLQVATLLAILARPTQQISIHRHGTSNPDRVIAIQTLSHVVQSMEDGLDVITPERDSLTSLAGRRVWSTVKSFSLPGSTWHDMVAQAKYAKEDQLSRIAELDGLDGHLAPIAASLAKAHETRMDARVISYRGKARWLGSELSWITISDDTWLVDDGGRFGRTTDLTRRRAVFHKRDVADSLKSALINTGGRF